MTPRLALIILAAIAALAGPATFFVAVRFTGHGEETRVRRR